MFPHIFIAILFPKISPFLGLTSFSKETLFFSLDLPEEIFKNLNCEVKGIQPWSKPGLPSNIWLLQKILGNWRRKKNHRVKKSYIKYHQSWSQWFASELCDPESFRSKSDLLILKIKTAKCISQTWFQFDSAKVSLHLPKGPVVFHSRMHVLVTWAQ